jgi:hypothetical protein
METYPVYTTQYSGMATPCLVVPHQSHYPYILNSLIVPIIIGSLSTFNEETGMQRGHEWQLQVFN